MLNPTMSLEFHDDSQTVIIRDASGVSERPYTAEEIVEAAARAAVTTNAETLRVDALGQIPAMLATIETLKAITDTPTASLGAAEIKVIARELRKTARQQLRLARLLLSATESADIGTA
jgi:hypothetical protein